MFTWSFEAPERGWGGLMFSSPFDLASVASVLEGMARSVISVAGRRRRIGIQTQRSWDLANLGIWEHNLVSCLGP